MAREKPPAPAKERIREFFIFCDALERHPFLTAHPGRGSFEHRFEISATKGDSTELSFDPDHLETFVNRLRQVCFEGELFFYKDLRRAAIELWGEDESFQRFYDRFVQVLNSPTKALPTSWYKPNGREVTTGHTVPELIEAFLYTGRAHSERRVNATPGSAEEGLADAHPAASSHLTLLLAWHARTLAQNVFSLRRRLLEWAKAVGEVSLFPELQRFHNRVRAAGDQFQKP